MTYFQFHLLFNLPVYLVLKWLNRERGWVEGELLALSGVLLVVMLFTSPWDNWAVKKGIWDFPPKRYWKRIGWLPFEEYLFFVWQTMNVILLTRWCLQVRPDWLTQATTPLGWGQVWGCGLILLVWLGWGWRHQWRAPQARWNYAWHLLFWFGPVVLWQWALAPGLFLAALPLVLAVTLFWGTYYTLADVVAVRAGVWFFDEKQITGWRLGGILPWEEIAFFYLTSLLVVQSYLLLLPAALR